MSKIIAFGHRKNVGKDTAADYLVSKGWVKMSFADPLKKVCSEMFNIPLVNFYNSALKEQVIPYWNKSPREILILIGTRMVRNFNTNEFNGKSHWINLIKSKIMECKQNIVIADLRFPNELEFLKNINATVVKIIRTDVSADNDVDSELTNYTFDYTIKNNKTKEDLYKEIDNIVNIVMS
jgi:hypothetical protein